jgi:hypothetical protein
MLQVTKVDTRYRLQGILMFDAEHIGCNNYNYYYVGSSPCGLDGKELFYLKSAQCDFHSALKRSLHELKMRRKYNLRLRIDHT